MKTHKAHLSKRPNFSHHWLFIELHQDRDSYNNITASHEDKQSTLFETSRVIPPLVIPIIPPLVHLNTSSNIDYYNNIKTDVLYCSKRRVYPIIWFLSTTLPRRDHCTKCGIYPYFSPIQNVVLVWFRI